MQLVVPRAVMMDAMMLAMIWRMVFQVSLLVFIILLMVYWLYIIPRDVFSLQICLYRILFLRIIG